MRPLLVILLTLSFICFSVALVSQTRAAMSYSNGTYTNVCGSGTSATSHTCNRGCDPAKGACSANGNTVVKYTCDGRTTECRQNESGFASSQQLGNPGCGKTVQIDVFNKNCRASGGWDCSDKDLHDYLVWYSGDCQAPAKTTEPVAQSCQDVQPIDVLFKRPGSNQWVDGASLTASGIQQGEEFEVNCFATNGTSLLPAAVIELTPPQGSTSRVSNKAELRNYRSFQAGTHVFRCVSDKLANCSTSDSVVIKAPNVVTQAQAETTQKSLFDRILPQRNQPRGSANPTPVAPSPTPSPTPLPEHKSACQDLDIVGGQNSLVPATVTLRATASDNRGSIQKYKFYFGDGAQQESDSPEVQHRYESSGTFTARVEIKDSQGNWKTSPNCEDKVLVKASPVESHKSSCSDIVITADNDGRAPANVSVKVTGYDNKGDLQRYRVDFDNGIVKEGEGQTLEQRFEKAGTYVIRGYVRDSQGNWVGGDNSCRKTLYINTEPLTKQPETGTPTLFTIAGLLSGAGGVGIQIWQRKLKSLVG